MSARDKKTECTGRTKVMLSMTTDDLRRIDQRADAAHMTRSAYVVEMTLREEVGLMRAIEMLRKDLRRFSTDKAGWRSRKKSRPS